MFSYIERILYDNTIEEEYYKKLRQKSSSNSAIVVGLVAAVGGFLYGYDTGLINDILEMKYVYSTFPSNGTSFSTHERALITAILSLGTFFGALIAPLISDNYGRKFSIIFASAVVFNVGNILQLASSTIPFLCVGRAVSGVAVGILSAIVPLYQAEASPKWVRGSVVFTYQWAITWGLLLASAICQGTRRINSSASYRIPVGLQFLWALILSSGMMFLPESPRYYVQKNNIHRALNSLSKLRRLPPDDADLIEELVEIKANYDYELSFGKTTMLDCFRNGGGRHKQVLRMITGIGVQVFQQCSGINFIFYYGVNFFSSTGIHNYYIMSFITYLVNTIFTIPGIILVDIIGRRKLLIYGGIGMSVANYIIAITGVSVPKQEVGAILSISFSCVFIAFFASSWGGCAWAVSTDIYGISIRQKAISLTAASNWLVNFVFAYITPYLIDTGNRTVAIGNKIFFIWGSCNAAGVIFVFFTVYETKGLKLEEIDFMYNNCSSARMSTKFKSRKIFNLDHTYNDLVSNALSPAVSNPDSPTDKPDGGAPGSNSDKTVTTSNNNEKLSSQSNSNLHDLGTDFMPLYNNLENKTHEANHIAILHNDIFVPSFSSDSGASSLDSSSLPLHTRNYSASSTSTAQNVSTPQNDYQAYLDSLKRDYNTSQLNNDNRYTTAQPRTMSMSQNNTASSVFPTLSNQEISLVSTNSRFMTEKDLRSMSAEYKSLIDNRPKDSDPNTSDDTKLAGPKMTIIAAPFFNQPPSDSDTGSEDEED